MRRCSCAIATKWWKPGSNPMHGDFCSQVGRTGPWAGDRPAIHAPSAPPQTTAHMIFDDGQHYGTAWPTMDLTAWVLESSFDFNRPRA